MASLPGGSALDVLAAHAPFLLVLVVAGIVLLVRWLENGDRSSYAVGAACGVAAAGYLLVILVVALAEDPAALFAVADGGGHWAYVLGWAEALAGLVLIAVALFGTLRPLAVTGAFLAAPQGTVRRRFKAVESSWQLAIGAFGAAVVFRLLLDVLGRLG